MTRGRAMEPVEGLAWQPTWRTSLDNIEHFTKIVLKTYKQNRTKKENPIIQHKSLIQKHYLKNPHIRCHLSQAKTMVLTQLDNTRKENKQNHRSFKLQENDKGNPYNAQYARTHTKDTHND